MAKQQLWTNMSNQLDQLFAELDDIKSGLKSGNFDKKKVVTYYRTFANFEQLQRQAEAHLATYKNGWSKFKGRVDPTLKKKRDDFSMRVTITRGVVNEFRDLLAEVDKIAK
jgi:hypothetical protein